MVNVVQFNPYHTYALSRRHPVGRLRGASYGYDGNGTLNLGANGGLYSYDAQNRLITANSSGITGGNTDLIAYDSKNRVVERTVNGTSTYYIYDGWDLIEERDSSGTVLATYVHGVRQDELLSRTSPAGTIYYHHNALGSVTDLTNASGVVVEKYQYDAYGKPTITDGSGNPLAATAYGNRFLFTGREYLAELNLYDYRNRVYSPDLGRFLQTDPLRFSAGDVNIYRYVGNNPINGTDSFGLWTWGDVAHAAGDLAGGAVGAIVGGAAGAVGGAVIGAVTGAVVGAVVGAELGPEGAVGGFIGGAISGADFGMNVGGAAGALVGGDIGSEVGGEAATSLYNYATGNSSDSNESGNGSGNTNGTGNTNSNNNGNTNGTGNSGNNNNANTNGTGNSDSNDNGNFDDDNSDDCCC